MPIYAMLFGAALIGVGVYGYVDTGSKHPTALIPAALGVVIALLGAGALSGGAIRKHTMHAAAAIALLGALMTIPGVLSFASMMTTSETEQVRQGVSQAKTPQDETEKNKEKLMAGVSKTATFALCAIFVGFCVKSFIDARLARQGATPTSSQAAPSTTA
jgi:hypothetical protein